MRRRVRIRDVVANANAKINQAGGTLSGIDELAVNAGELIDELLDGFSISLVRTGDYSVLEWLTAAGEDKRELPISLRIDVTEDETIS